MIRKWKCFFKCNAKAALWLTYYLAVQSIVCIGIFFYLLYHDERFCERFIDIFGPVVDIKNYWDRQLASYDALKDLLSGYSGMMIGASSLAILALLLIWCRIRKVRIIEKPQWLHLIGCYCVGCVLNLLLTAVIDVLPDTWMHAYDSTTSFALSDTFLFNLFAVGILGPVTEEVIFRYGIMRSFYPFSVKYAIVYSGILFGMLHGNPVQIIYATLLGWLFGYLYYRTDSLQYTIMLHVGINSSSVIVNELFDNEITGLLYVCLIISLINILISRIRYIRNC